MALTGHPSDPMGVILAGGGGRRIGGDKACVVLRGRPLISYPLAALYSVLSEVAVLAKPSTLLPELADTEVWLEPEEPQHPLLGLVRALELAAPRAILACPVDLPLVGHGLLRRLANGPGPLASIAADTTGPQPLLGRYEPAALSPLQEALAEDPPARMRSLAERLDASIVPVGNEFELLNVNIPEDLRRATAQLRARGGPRVSRR